MLKVANGVAYWYISFLLCCRIYFSKISQRPSQVEMQISDAEYYCIGAIIIKYYGKICADCLSDDASYGLHRSAKRIADDLLGSPAALIDMCLFKCAGGDVDTKHVSDVLLLAFTNPLFRKMLTSADSSFTFSETRHQNQDDIDASLGVSINYRLKYTIISSRKRSTPERSTLQSSQPTTATPGKFAHVAIEELIKIVSVQPVDGGVRTPKRSISRVTPPSSSASVSVTFQSDSAAHVKASAEDEKDVPSTACHRTPDSSLRTPTLKRSISHVTPSVLVSSTKQLFNAANAVRCTGRKAGIQDMYDGCLHSLGKMLVNGDREEIQKLDCYIIGINNTYEVHSQSCVDIILPGMGKHNKYGEESGVTCIHCNKWWTQGNVAFQRRSAREVAKKMDTDVFIVAGYGVLASNNTLAKLPKVNLLKFATKLYNMEFVQQHFLRLSLANSEGAREQRGDEGATNEHLSCESFSGDEDEDCDEDDAATSDDNCHYKNDTLCNASCNADADLSDAESSDGECYQLKPIAFLDLPEAPELLSTRLENECILPSDVVESLADLDGNVNVCETSGKVLASDSSTVATNAEPRTLEQLLHPSHRMKKWNEEKAKADMTPVNDVPEYDAPRCLRSSKHKPYSLRVAARNLDLTDLVNSIQFIISDLEEYTAFTRKHKPYDCVHEEHKTQCLCKNMLQRWCQRWQGKVASYPLESETKEVCLSLYYHTSKSAWDHTVTKWLPLASSGIMCDMAKQFNTLSTVDKNIRYNTVAEFVKLMYQAQTKLRKAGAPPDEVERLRDFICQFDDTYVNEELKMDHSHKRNVGFVDTRSVTGAFELSSSNKKERLTAMMAKQLSLFILTSMTFGRNWRFVGATFAIRNSTGSIVYNQMNKCDIVFHAAGFIVHLYTFDNGSTNAKALSKVVTEPQIYAAGENRDVDKHFPYFERNDATKGGVVLDKGPAREADPEYLVRRTHSLYDQFMQYFFTDYVHGYKNWKHFYSSSTKKPLIWSRYLSRLVKVSWEKFLKDPMAAYMNSGQRATMEMHLDMNVFYMEESSWGKMVVRWAAMFFSNKMQRALAEIRFQMEKGNMKSIPGCCEAVAALLDYMYVSNIWFDECNSRSVGVRTNGGGSDMKYAIDHTMTDHLEVLRSLPRMIDALAIHIRRQELPLGKHFISHQSHLAICTTGHGLASFAVEYSRDSRPGSRVLSCLNNSDPCEQENFMLKNKSCGVLTIKKAEDILAHRTAIIVQHVRNMILNDFVIPGKGHKGKDGDVVKIRLRCKGNTASDENDEYMFHDVFIGKALSNRTTTLTLSGEVEKHKLKALQIVK